MVNGCGQLKRSELASYLSMFLTNLYRVRLIAGTLLSL